MFDYDSRGNEGRDTAEELAAQIVKVAGGHFQECVDWLTDGDPDGMSLDELVQEWREADCTYSA